MADGAKAQLIIAVDFDGTCVDHRYPELGDDVPHAVESLREIVRRGHKLVLNTMRGCETRDGDTYSQALRWFSDRDIAIVCAFRHWLDTTWTDSIKLYAHHYIDDAAVGCPIRENPRHGGRPYVDWPRVMDLLFGSSQEAGHG